MKTKTPTPKKEVRGPLMDWRQPIYSESALKVMEAATGQHFASDPRPVPAPAPAPVAETA